MNDGVYDNQFGIVLRLLILLSIFEPYNLRQGKSPGNSMVYYYIYICMSGVGFGQFLFIDSDSKKKFNMIKNKISIFEVKIRIKQFEKIKIKSWCGVLGSDIE